MFDMKNEKIKDELIEEATIVLDQNSKNGITIQKEQKLSYLT